MVWERLCAVNGDTEYVDASFTGHADRSVMRDALEAARLAQDAFRDVVPPPGTLSQACLAAGSRWQLQIRGILTARRLLSEHSRCSPAVKPTGAVICQQHLCNG